MMKQTMALVVALTLMLAAGPMRAQAQNPPSPPAPPARPDGGSTRSERSADNMVPLRVVVVIASFQGDKKVSSLPYTLSVNANAGAAPARVSQVRMGARVPVPAMKAPTVDGRPISEAIPGVPSGGGPVTYQDIGTNIDCAATARGDGRFELTLSIEDSSVVADQTARTPPKADDPPIFRSFRLSNQVILRDGQTTQFTAATDRISGEVIKVDVTVTVIK